MTDKSRSAVLKCNKVVKKNALLVDDKETIAKIIKVYIADIFDCVYFDDPIKAIAWLQSGNMPDLII